MSYVSSRPLPPSDKARSRSPFWKETLAPYAKPRLGRSAAQWSEGDVFPVPYDVELEEAERCSTCSRAHPPSASSTPGLQMGLQIARQAAKTYNPVGSNPSL